MKQWVFAIVAGTVLLAALAFILPGGGEGGAEASGFPEMAALQEAAPEEAVPELAPGEQPIQFPHDVHARDFQIDCQYCHFSADRSSTAGIPAVATCMGCHNIIAGEAQAAEIEELRGYWEREEPIPWARVYRIADHVQFPHMRHVAAGVECVDCHGQVEEIGVIQEVAQPLTMGWCVSCHVQEGASRDCAVCHF